MARLVPLPAISETLAAVPNETHLRALDTNQKTSAVQRRGPQQIRYL